MDRPCDICGKTETETGLEHELTDHSGVEELLCSVCVSVLSRGKTEANEQSQLPTKKKKVKWQKPRSAFRLEMDRMESKWGSLDLEWLMAKQEVINKEREWLRIRTMHTNAKNTLLKRLIREIKDGKLPPNPSVVVSPPPKKTILPKEPIDNDYHMGNW